MMEPFTDAQSRSPLKFFLWVFVLTVPFYLLGAVTDLQLLPGLPASAFAFICPVTAAAILVYGKDKASGVIELLRRAFDYQRIKVKIWSIPVLLLIPGMTVLMYGLMRLSGVALPPPQIPAPGTLFIFMAFFVGALGEELGWSGYVLDPLQAKWGALGAGILLGLVWAVWHWVPLMEAGRSPAWIAWWSCGTVASRVLMTWLYNNTGKSVFAATLYHSISNLSWQLFPSAGSHWDPRIYGLLVVFAASVVTTVWGPRTLARPSKENRRAP